MSGIRLRVHMPSYEFSYDKKQIGKVMRAAGNEVAQITRKLLSNTAGTGRLYYSTGGSAAEYRGGYRKTRHFASAAGTAPVRVTGSLARSIRVTLFKSGEGVAIRDAIFYALFLQAGAKGGAPKGGRSGKGLRNVYEKRGGVNRLAEVKGIRILAPRPFLSIALESREASISARIQASLKDDIAFVRIKA
jgi:hypothetical protein